MADREVARLVAGAPDWPTLDELWADVPPVPPPLEDDGVDRWSDAVRTGPAGADVDPSGWLAWDLDVCTTDPRLLSDAEVIDAMAGFGRVGTWAQARQARLVAEFERRRPGSASRYTADEVSLALSVSRFAAVGLLDRSRRLVDTLHDTLAAFETGRVDGFKVRVICEAVRYLDDAQAEWVQDQVLEQAPLQSVAQLRAGLERAVIAANPEGANTRHRQARKDRRVGVGQEADGMATFWASLSAQDAQAAFGTLTGLARSLGAADPRGMDARRADLLVGITTGEVGIAFPTPSDGPRTADADGTTDPGPEASTAEAHGAPSDGAPSDGAPSDSAPSDSATSDSATSDSGASDRAATDGGSSGGGDASGRDTSGGGASGAVDGEAGVESCPACAAQAGRSSRPQLTPVNPTKPLVQVLMAHSTLRGVDHAPAELVGYGAICAEQAREIAADAVWRRLVYDDESGAVLDYGRRTYRPPAALADHVRARDVHCRSPLCRRRALDCELDHSVAFPEGPTAEPNLAAGCLLHHDEKHSPGWTVLQHPDGRVEWTTPTGHVYSSEVHDYRPLPPPPPLTIPGPIADRTDTQPSPKTPRVRTRVTCDWTGADDGEPTPF